MKKTLAGSLMALLLIAFLTACTGTGGGGGGGGGGAGGSGTGPSPVNLGGAGSFVILAKAAVTNTPTSAVTGDVGISPAAASFITGFALTLVPSAPYSTSTQVTGKVYAPGYAVPTPATLTVAVGAMQTAYTDAAGRSNPDHTELGAGDISGLTLAPGLYKWGTGVSINTDVTLKGGASDTWIFQIGGGLTMAAAKKIILSGGAQAKNIVWQVASGATFGTTSHMEGIVMSKTAITLATGASINGRLYAQTAVTISGSAVTHP